MYIVAFDAYNDTKNITVTLIFWMTKLRGERASDFVFLIFSVCSKAYTISIPWGHIAGHYATVKNINMKEKLLVLFFSINTWQKGTVFPLVEKKFLGGYIFFCKHIPLFIEGERISWSILPLLHSCLMIPLCPLSIDTPVTVSQLNFMYVSFVFMVSPSRDFRIGLPFYSFQYILIKSGGKSSRRPRYVPALWSVLRQLKEEVLWAWGKYLHWNFYLWGKME